MHVVLLTSVTSGAKRLFRALGSYQLAWYLRKHGYETQVLDFIHELDKAKILELIGKFVKPETRILGWSGMLMPGDEKWWLKFVCEELMPELRRRYPQLKLITGGAPVHEVNRLYRNRRAFDYFFYGHAEDTLLAFCNHVYRGAPMPQMELMLGNRVIRESAVLPESQSRFGIQDCDHLWHDRDCIQPGESLPIEMSRGCIFKCKFCRYPYIGKTKNDFTRRMELVAQELAHNHEKWGVRNYYMLEDTFNDSNDKIEAFVDVVRRLPFRMRFASYLRPDLLWAHPGQAEKLQEAGLISAFLGVESLSGEASRLIGKGWSGTHAREYIPRLYHDVWKRGTTFRMGLIVGIPPETRDDMMTTHQWAVDQGLPNWKWHLLSVNRDSHGPWVSEFDRHADQYGFDWYTDNGVTRWKTSTMTWRDGKTLKDELTTLAKPYQKQECWGLIERGTYGYDLDHEKDVRLVDVDKQDAAQRRQVFLDRYVDSLSALPN
jgi:Radical SAM superfamily